jgi:hypothetical protein
MIAFMAGEHVERTDDDRMGDGHDSPFLPTPGCEALI